MPHHALETMAHLQVAHLQVILGQRRASLAQCKTLFRAILYVCVLFHRVLALPNDGIDQQHISRSLINIRMYPSAVT